MRGDWLVSLVFASVVLGCASTAPSQRVETFVFRLECGLAKDVVGAMVMDTKGLRVHEVGLRADGPHLIVSRKNTLAELWFDNAGLVAHRVTWSYPITRAGYRQKVNLCTGDRLVELSLVGPSSFAGAAVAIDGRNVGVLSKAGTLTIYVQLGQHQVNVSTPQGPWTKDLAYGPAASGYDRLPIPEDIIAHAATSHPLGNQ